MADTTNPVPALPASITGAADPCLAFVTEWKAARDQCNGAPSDAFWEARVKPLEDVASFGTIPAATTMLGAASALRWALDLNAEEGNEGCLEPQDANLIRAALGFLSRALIVTEPDPMADAVGVYLATQEEERACDARGDGRGADEACTRGVSMWDTIQKDPPAITSPAGAIAAIRFVATDSNWVDDQHARLLNLALAQLKGKAS